MSSKVTYTASIRISVFSQTSFLYLCQQLVSPSSCTHKQHSYEGFLTPVIPLHSLLSLSKSDLSFPAFFSPKHLSCITGTVPDFDESLYNLLQISRQLIARSLDGRLARNISFSTQTIPLLLSRLRTLFNGLFRCTLSHHEHTCDIIRCIDRQYHTKMMSVRYFPSSSQCLFIFVGG